MPVQSKSCLCACGKRSLFPSGPLGAGAQTLDSVGRTPTALVLGPAEPYPVPAAIEDSDDSIVLTIEPTTIAKTATPTRRWKRKKKVGKASVFERPSLWEQFQNGELASGTLFRVVYSVLAPIAPALYVFGILVALGAAINFATHGFGELGGLHEGKVNAPLMVALTVTFVIWMAHLWWRYLARPVWNARLRYFHSSTLGAFYAARRQSGNADRYCSLMNVRRFLFSLPNTGRRFQARWNQNLSLFVAYAVVHRVVRSEGRLPSEARLTAVYAAVTKRLQQEHPELHAFQSGSTSEVLAGVRDFFVTRGHERNTFFPIGELVQAVGNVRRTKIYPWWYGNKREDDLGTIVDGLFDRAVSAEDYFREHHELHQARGFDFRELGDNEEMPRHLMHCEHRWLSRMTYVVGDWWFATPSILPEFDRSRGR